MKISSLASEARDLIQQFETTTFPQHPLAEGMSGVVVGSRTDVDREFSDLEDQAAGAADISLQKVEHVSKALDAYLASLGVDLQFHIDERTEKIQVEVREPGTDKLIRKIPADELLELAASIEQMVGFFLDKTL